MSTPAALVVPATVPGASAPVPSPPSLEVVLIASRTLSISKACHSYYSSMVFVNIRRVFQLGLYTSAFIQIQSDREEAGSLF